MDSYAAGLIDGEGYIGIIKDNSNHSYNIRVQISMSDKGKFALERMKDKYGGSISKDNKATNRVRQAYGWTVTGRKAVELLRIIQPDSMVKKEVINIALRYWNLIEKANKKPNGQVEWTPELEAKASYYQGLIKEKNRRGPDPVEFSDNPIAVCYAGSWWKPEEDEDGPVPFDKRFPPHGLTQNGKLYERPTLERHTAENESLCLLPTPTQTDYKRDGSAPSSMRRKSPAVTVVNAHFPLLPTPNTMDHREVRTGYQREKQLHRGDFNSPRRSSMGNLREDIVIARESESESPYGRYAQAVERWSEEFRPAPAPTFINEKGQERLDVKFAEWMMGLPDGWVTDVPGLSRAQQIKAIGNGVVPQQAAAALLLLKGI